MRIIAGSLGGRMFASPNGNRTHPMSDKIRGALFNALGDIDGLTVFDPFGGTGALSFEAMSRGARSATVLDNDPAAYRTIGENIRSLKLENKVSVSKAAAGPWLATAKQNFDLVLLDPPYDRLQPQLLTELAKRAKVGGVVVLSLPPDARFKLSDDYEQLLYKQYGDAELVFYRRTT